MPTADSVDPLRILSPGSALGRWVVAGCANPGLPRRYDAHRHDDASVRVSVTTLPKETHSVDRLRREASILRDLSHFAVPLLVDFGLSREHGVVWMATEDVGGDLLSDRLLMGPLPWREACAAFHDVALGLAHAHAHGLVHRDVHPGKVLLADGGRAQIVGFEAAQRLDGTEEALDAPPGPVGYLAPEVITRGARVGPRADLYALGVVLFEALTGRPAFPAALMDDRVDPSERMLDWKTRSDPLMPGGDVPPWLANLVAKATHPDPAERLPDLDAFVGWLDAARGLWAPEEVPEPPRTLPVDAPPPVLSMRPSIAHLGEREPFAPDGDEVHWRPMAYTTAASLGVMLGLVFGLAVIVLTELPYLS